MKLARIVLTAVAALAGCVTTAQVSDYMHPDSEFEPQGFNVTTALQDFGVDISSLPESHLTSSNLNQRSLSAPCSLACASLNIVFGSDQVLSNGTPTYESFTGSYWSAQQAALNPLCVFKPTKTSDVSILILLARLYQCPFAVKGGGHAAWAGASSIEGGITVSMENFRQITVSSDKQTVDVGPGLRWVEVYTAVENHGLTVVGGRMSPVGVPGLILGGGISHFSNKFGWACDNVASFELVTASGLTVNVTPTSYTDLYWALRGGSGNFGIVTKFKLVAFPLGQMWGGQRVYLEDSFSDVLDAIHQFTVTGSMTDLDAAQIITFANAPGVGKITFANLHYAKPAANAPVFSSWNNITAIQDSTGMRSMSEMAILLNEGAPAPGAYHTWWDITLKMDRQLLQFIVDTFYAQDAAIANVEKILFIAAMQPITQGAMDAMQKNGGNALGLDPNNGPYFVLNFAAAWTKKEDEPIFRDAISNIIKTIKSEAKRRNLDNSFIYLNYASQYQDPIGSYGAANKQRLIDISNKYDPSQVFQHLHTGGFKLIKRAQDPN